jgi:peptidoglycan glycosyltransferase
MNRRIRLLAFVLAACFGLLFLQLNNLQVRQASQLQAKSAQLLPVVSTWYGSPRGEILSSDGAVLAYSSETAGGNYVRHYPYGSLFADITGYFDAVQDAAPYGLEAEYNNYLVEHQSTTGGLSGVLAQAKGTDSVVVTLNLKLQQLAAAELDGFLGAIVAINPQNGDILAMYSNPTYDPNKLSTLDAAANQAYYNSVANSRPNASWGGALLNSATNYPIAPGSTFKVITTSAIYDQDPSLESINVPYASGIPIPDTNAILHNYADEVCGGTLAVILAKSCDTAYAKIGLDLGATKLYNEATSFGFDSVPPIDLPSGEVAASNFPAPATFIGNEPAVAYSAIGQEDVSETALQDALVASAIGDNGTIMKPHIMANIVSDVGQVVKTYAPSAWLQATSADTAGSVRSLMVGVSTFGTAAGVFDTLSVPVAAKTGTAETGTGDCSADWLIATAPAGPGQTPTAAVAAVLPYQSGLTCSDTGAVAAGPRVAAQGCVGRRALVGDPSL